MAINPQDQAELQNLRQQLLAALESEGLITLTPKQVRAIMRVLLDHELRLQALEP